METELIVKVLNMIQAAFAWLQNRGIARDRIQKILDEAEGGDISSDVVQAELDSLASELDETEKLIDSE